VSPLERRLLKAEKVIKPEPVMTQAEIDARLDELFSKLGTSRGAVIAQYGGLGQVLRVLQVGQRKES
jgi:hypothetical protein